MTGQLLMVRRDHHAYTYQTNGSLDFGASRPLVNWSQALPVLRVGPRASYYCLLCKTIFFAQSFDVGSSNTACQISHHRQLECDLRNSAYTGNSLVDNLIRSEFCIQARRYEDMELSVEMCNVLGPGMHMPNRPFCVHIRVGRSVIWKSCQ